MNFLQCKCPTDKSWDSIESVFSYEARNKNVHEEKGRIVAEIIDEKCQWDLTSLRSSSCCVNGLNTELQGL